MRNQKRPYADRIQPNRFAKSARRKKIKKARKRGFFKYFFAVIRVAKAKGKKINTRPIYKPFDNSYDYQIKRLPSRGDNIAFISEIPDAFDKSLISLPIDGKFIVPNPFSLTLNAKNSFLFLKKLFKALDEDRFETVTLDFGECEQIDIDALLCMDILMDEFIEYYKRCSRRQIKHKLINFDPQNFHKESIAKILFSIGTLKNVGRSEIKRNDIIPFHLIKGNNFTTDAGARREKELTKMVDYIVERCKEMNRTLTWQAENRLSKVIGEVLVNAAEHSGRKFRYAVGYFEKKKEGDNDIGIFNFAILSFGKTIYQNFKNSKNKGWPIIERMKELSAKYTSRNLFSSKEFEEETLWTLYALQEGVTSVQDRKRGNGSINFIESFFSLKGDMQNDHLSFLTILSGNTRITFDGKYEIVEKQRGVDPKPFKMMTFNASGEIEDKPDSDCVSFAENFFPGTLITARICINFNNIEIVQDHG